jgi:hypothetical protein
MGSFSSTVKKSVKTVSFKARTHAYSYGSADEGRQPQAGLIVQINV